MIPYILIIVLPAIFGFVAVKKEDKNPLALCVGNNAYTKENNLGILLFFIMLFLLLALRDETIGRDLLRYKTVFCRDTAQEISSLLAVEPEVLFKLLNWCIGHITTNYQIYIAIMAFLTIVPIAIIYNQDRYYSYLKIILFVSMITFVMLFSGIRQSLAMAVGMLAYLFVKNKKLVPYLIMVVIGIGFHHSAVILLFMYPIYHATLKRKHLLFIIPVISVIFIFNQQIFSFIEDTVFRHFEDYNVETTASGAYGSLVLFILLAIVCYAIPDETKIDKETMGLRNLLLFAIMLQCFAPVHHLAMRMNYYFILFIPILIPKILKIPRPALNSISKCCGVVMAVFFTLDYFISTYNSYVTGISTLDTIPYIPFWRG